MARSAVLPGGLLLLASAAASCGPGTSTRPDVLVVLVDTLRADRLPFYGYPRDTAPFLAGWAERSVVFERAWAASSWTAPATASLFCGVYPDQHGVVVGMQTFQRLRKVAAELELNRIPAELETLPEFLRARGYRTFGVAANPNVGTEMGFDRGFDRFVCTPDLAGEDVVAALRQWEDEIRAAEPWFVYLHFMDPHFPYEPRAPHYRAPAEDDPIAMDAAAYDSEIRHLDGVLEGLFAELGVGEDTVVVFVADHGEEFGDHGGRYHEPQLYSELTRVPFFLHVPGIEPRRVRANVSQVDLLPTLRELLGAPRAPSDAGQSLLGLARGGAPPSERPLFTMRRARVSELRAVILGEHKYIVTEFDEGLEVPRIRELYDLAADPRETSNLADAEGGLAERLDAILRAHQADSPRWSSGAKPYELSEELLEKLQHLGYGGGDDDGHALPRDIAPRDIAPLDRKRAEKRAPAGDDG